MSDDEDPLKYQRYKPTKTDLVWHTKKFDKRRLREIIKHCEGSEKLLEALGFKFDERAMYVPDDLTMSEIRLFASFLWAMGNLRELAEDIYKNATRDRNA